MYLDRIAIPHATLEDTFSALSPFITKYEPEEYEKTMENCSKINAATRKLLTEREAFEQNLVRAQFSLSVSLFDRSSMNTTKTDPSVLYIIGCNGEQRGGIYKLFDL